MVRKRVNYRTSACFAVRVRPLKLWRSEMTLFRIFFVLVLMSFSGCYLVVEEDPMNADDDDSVSDDDDSVSDDDDSVSDDDDSASDDDDSASDDDDSVSDDDDDDDSASDDDDDSASDDDDDDDSVNPNPGVCVVANPGAPVPSGAYDGSLASMYCEPLTVLEVGTVGSVVIEVGVEHTWAGDMTLKLVSPSGAIATLVSRPGMAESDDDGTGCCGSQADLDSQFPLTFDEMTGFDAETMGVNLSSGQTICEDDGECAFFPNAGAATTGTLSGLVGEAIEGIWQVCMGDANSTDDGRLFSAELNLNGGCP